VLRQLPVPSRWFRNRRRGKTWQRLRRHHRHRHPSRKWAGLARRRRPPGQRLHRRQSRLLKSHVRHRRPRRQSRRLRSRVRHRRLHRRVPLRRRQGRLRQLRLPRNVRPTTRSVEVFVKTPGLNLAAARSPPPSARIAADVVPAQASLMAWAESLFSAEAGEERSG